MFLALFQRQLRSLFPEMQARIRVEIQAVELLEHLKSASNKPQLKSKARPPLSKPLLLLPLMLTKSKRRKSNSISSTKC